MYFFPVTRPFLGHFFKEVFFSPLKNVKNKKNYKSKIAEKLLKHFLKKCFFSPLKNVKNKKNYKSKIAEKLLKHWSSIEIEAFNLS